MKGSLWNLIRGRIARPKLRYQGGDQAQPFAHDPNCTRTVHSFDVCGPARPSANDFYHRSLGHVRRIEALD